MNGNDQNGDYQLFGEHQDPPEPLELSLKPDLGYPPPDPPFKTTVYHPHRPIHHHHCFAGAGYGDPRETWSNHCVSLHMQVGFFAGVIHLSCPFFNTLFYISTPSSNLCNSASTMSKVFPVVSTIIFVVISKIF